MQSDAYGDIADLTRAVRVVTPAGTLVTRPVPSTSTGPSVREMVLGSEGRLGVITEATVHVRRVPAERVVLGYLFPTWDDGLAAMRDIAASEAAPSVTRVSDAPETAFSFATRKAPTPLDRVKSRALTTFLERRKGFDVSRMCLSFIGFEGTARHVKEQRAFAGRIVSRHGGLCIGRSPGELYDQKKFDTPYIRDFLLDRGVLADVSETAAPWSALRPVYDAVTAAARGAFADLGVPGYVMCHLSHSYHAGACLYFTFAISPRPEPDPLDQYARVKSAIQQAFVDHGATLSHHHAVGTEHAEWLEQDISAPGVALLRGLFDGVDPGAQPQPGEDRVTDGASSPGDARAARRRAEAAWARGAAGTAVREVVLLGVLQPLIALYARRTVTGREHLRDLSGPVLFVANHSSHMDTPLLLAALPGRWRRRTAVAAAADYFYTRPLLARTVSLAFNTVPVGRKGEAVVPGAQTLLERLLDDRWSLVIFAEGTRSRDGTVGRLRSGAAVLAAERGLTIVPVHVAGTHATMPVGRRWPRRRPGPSRHTVSVAFGPPIVPGPDEHRTDVMEHVRRFFDSRGAETTPDKRIAARRRRSTRTAGAG